MPGLARPSGPPARVGLTALLLAGVLLPVSAQTPPVYDVHNTVAWRHAVEEHRPGQDDEAVRYVSGWTRRELEALVPYVSRLEVTERMDVVRRALVLHTDVAVLNRTADGYGLPADSSPSDLLADGLLVGELFRTFHWEFSRRLLERLPDTDERKALARAYYRATGATLQWWGEQTELTPHLAAGRGLLGDDPVLLMYEATMRQEDADPRSQRYFHELRQAALRIAEENRAASASPFGQMLQVAEVPTPAELRAHAEWLLRRALEDDPELHEARIRLAHVLLDGNRHDDARRELDRLPSVSALPPFLGYYASLVRGRLHRTRDRLDAAREAFAEALALAPRSQTARLALSEVAMARGDRDAAVSYLQGVEAPLLHEEPWWLIGRLHEPDPREQLTAFWSSVE